MRKYLILLLAIVAVAVLPSCRGAVEKARRNIRVEKIEKIERYGLSGFDLTLRVKNDTRYRLRLDTVSLALFYDDSRVGTISLREGVEVPKRTTLNVTTQWRLRISDPLALYVVGKKLEAGDLSPLSVSVLVQGRGGPARIDISRERVPLSQFLATFNLSVEDITRYLKK